MARGDLPLTYLGDRGLTLETIEHFGLIEDDDRITIPYFNALGGVSGMRYRLLHADMKYISPPGQKTILYNIIDAGLEPVFLAEGEFDTMILHQTGRHAVGAAGVQGFKHYWAWLFVGTNVRICFDGDEAGRAGAMKVARMLHGIADEVDIIEIPQGEDITSLFMGGRLEGALEGF